MAVFFAPHNRGFPKEVCRDERHGARPPPMNRRHARRPLVLVLLQIAKKDLITATHCLELLAVDARLRVHGLAVRVALHVQRQPITIMLQSNSMRHERPVVHDGGERAVRMLK